MHPAPDATAVDLQLLGAPVARLVAGGRPQPLVLQAKRFALLAHLAVAAAPVRRDALLLLLWPELTDAGARGALSKALHYLRQAIGGEAIVTGADDTVTVDRTRVVTDVAALEAALAAGRPGDALATWRGALLEGFHLDDAPEFERWLDGERARIEGRVVRAVLREVDALETRGDLAAAATLALRLLDRRALDEPVLQRTLRLLDATGDRAGAIGAYERFATALRRELELAPSPETRALVAAIRAREAAHPGAIVAAEAARPLAAPDGALPTVTARTDAPRDDAAHPDVAPADATRTDAARANATPERTTPRTAPWLAAAALAIVGGVGAMAWRGAPAAGAATLDAERVAVVPFTDASGDATLAALPLMGADWIAQGLAAAPMLRVVPVTASLAVARAGGDTATPAGLARETGAATVVTGRVTRREGATVLQATVTDARRGTVVGAVAPVTVRDGGDLLAALDTLRARVLAVVGPHLDARLAYAAGTTSRPPSYEAYRAFAAGLEHFTDGEMRAAMAAFARAAAADSAWTLPLVHLGIAAANVRDTVAMADVVRRLGPRRATLAPYDRAGFDAVQAWLAGDRLASYAAAVRVAALAPGGVPSAQVGKEALDLGRPREAVRVLLALDPARGQLRGFMPYWWNLGDAAHVSGDFALEARTAARARGTFGDLPWTHALEVHAAIGAREDARARALTDSTDTRFLRVLRGPQGARQLRDHAGEALAHGDSALARSLAERGLAWLARLPDSLRTTPAATSDAVELLAMLGRGDAAQRILDAVPPVPEHGVLGLRLLVATVRRDTAAAARWDAALVARPQRWGQERWWRARAAALRGDAPRAAQLLREALAAGYAWSRTIHADWALGTVRRDPVMVPLLQPRE